MKLPKKGDMQECLNYRGIMLLSVAGKVLNRVISTLRIIVEQSMEWDTFLDINFVDYEKAFYSLDRDTLWKFLKHYEIPDKLISLIRNTYEDMACRVIHAGQHTDAFMVKTGVWKGCLL